MKPLRLSNMADVGATGPSDQNFVLDPEEGVGGSGTQVLCAKMFSFCWQNLISMLRNVSLDLGFG